MTRILVVDPGIGVLDTLHDIFAEHRLRPAAVLLDRDDGRFRNVPRYHYGESAGRLAALVRRAACVVGNDSFPAHLGAAVGTGPVLALLGPTKASVFAHAPNVTCLSGPWDCSGCHFAAPFRAACDQGCQSLEGLSVAAVFGRVAAVTGG